jgi:hypothetical protein
MSNLIQDGLWLSEWLSSHPLAFYGGLVMFGVVMYGVARLKKDMLQRLKFGHDTFATRREVKSYGLLREPRRNERR